MKHVFGPVPSRRLGYSLGLDPVVPKVCSMDCVYCELGPTTERTVCRRAFFDVDEILRDLEERLAEGPRVDTVTLSGSGEPTLHEGLEELIVGAKRLSALPVAVLTNASLMPDPAVRRALMRADVVAPSLDAVTPEVFERINRPDPSLDPGEIKGAIQAFTREFPGRVLLEIVFVRGMNDTPDEIARLASAAADIAPEVVHLNTVVRPPAVEGTSGLTAAELEAIAAEFGSRANVIASAALPPQSVAREVEARLVAMASRRPLTLDDVAVALGTNRAEAVKILGSLVDRGLLELVQHAEKQYYYCRPERGCA